MGRPSFDPEPHRRLVKTMAGYGIPQDGIATVVGCDPKTLRKHFAPELASGATEANAKVAESLYKKAIGEGQGAVTAAIFWAKTRMGWREPAQALELTGKDGGPIQTEDVTRDAEEFTRRVSGLAARAAESGGTGETDTGGEG